jgi:hypothetical protein
MLQQQPRRLEQGDNNQWAKYNKRRGVDTESVDAMRCQVNLLGACAICYKLLPYEF